MVLRFAVVCLSGCRYHSPHNRVIAGRREMPVASATSEINVAYVANLARLDLDAESCALFQRQLGTVVDYVQQLGALDLEGIEPTSHGQPVCNVFRADEERTSLEHEGALRNAPARLGAEFKVPRIMEHEG